MWRAARGLGRAIDAGESAPTGRVGVRDLGGGVTEVEVGRAAPSGVAVALGVALALAPVVVAARVGLSGGWSAWDVALGAMAVVAMALVGARVVLVGLGLGDAAVVTVSSEALVRRGAPRWMPWRRVIPTGVIGELRVAAEQDSEEGRCVVEVQEGARWRRLFAQLSAAEATAAASAIAARLGFQR